MDCQTARDLLALGRHCDAADRHAADAHLDGCAGCQAFAAGQAGFDAAVAAAMKSVALPANGRERAVAAATVRRAAVVRRGRRRLALAAAVVAAVLPAGYVGYFRFQPTVDTGELVAAIDRRRDDPERFATDWLVARGLPPTLPQPFDYRYFQDAVLADLGGKPTPCLLFARDRDTLRVFVLTRGRFRLDTLQPAQGSFATVQPVPPGPAHPGVAYLLEYTSPTLETFLRPADPGA